MRTEAQRQEWIARCERIQALLSLSLADVAQNIEPDDVARIREWIEVNETGLAIEELLLSLATVGQTHKAATGAMLDLAAAEMGGDVGLWKLPLDQLVDRLKVRGFT
jgi:hypothetical protein